MSAPLIGRRDALAKALRRIAGRHRPTFDRRCRECDMAVPPDGCPTWQIASEALKAPVASGAVIDAEDRAFAERFLSAWATPYYGVDQRDAVGAVLRALAAALTAEADQ